MTLALGTSLQHGTYVIDALSGEDSIGPLYLATHVPSGQWVVVRVLGSRHPESLPDAAQRNAFYQSLDALNQLGQAFLPKNLKGFEEERVCYQTFSLPQGSPLSQSVTPQSPRPLVPSLSLIQTLAQALQVLRPLGWAGLRITPDQVWQGPGGSLSLTGFDFPSAHPNTAVDEAEVVRGLTDLLYFLLTGQRAAQAPLGVDLRHRRPELPAGLDAVFQWANPSLALAQPPRLEQWLALLPQPVASDHAPRVSNRSQLSEQAKGHSSTPTPKAQRTTATTVLAAPVAPPPTPITPAMRSTQVSSPASNRGPWMAGALLTTGVVFGIGGVAFGLQARLHPSGPAAQTRFNPNQAFPPLPNWNSSSPGFDHPTVEGGRRSRPTDRFNEAPMPAVTPQPRPPQTNDGIALPDPTPDPAVDSPDLPLAPNPMSPAVGEDGGRLNNNAVPDSPESPAPTVNSDDLPVVPQEAVPDPIPAPVQSNPDPAPAPPSAPASADPPAPDAVAPPPLAPAPAPPAPLTSS